MDKSNIKNDFILGLIPARGGSKSIPFKNIASLGGKPMIQYVVEAGKKSKLLSKMVCSTEHENIADACQSLPVEIYERPDELAQDDTHVIDVIKNVLQVLLQREKKLPGMVALLQPTSPFLLATHIDECVNALQNNTNADSAQTVSAVIHNSHAFNQRVIENGLVQFRFLQERRAAYNKQLKPKHYTFGNLVVTRTSALLEGKDCFGDISVPVEIPRQYALDVDTAEDLDYANYLLSQNKIDLKDAN